MTLNIKFGKIQVKVFKKSVEVLHLLGNKSVSEINAFYPSIGEAFVVTDSGTLTSGSLAVSAGDLVEYSDCCWKMIKEGSGGFPADETRVILSTKDELSSPYDPETDSGKIVEFRGDSLTGVDVREVEDGLAVFVHGDSVYSNLGYVYYGIIPDGEWINLFGPIESTLDSIIVADGETVIDGDTGSIVIEGF